MRNIATTLGSTHRGTTSERMEGLRENLLPIDVNRLISKKKKNVVMRIRNA